MVRNRKELYKIAAVKKPWLLKNEFIAIITFWSEILTTIILLVLINCNFSLFGMVNASSGETHARKSLVNFLWLMYHSLLECLSTLIICKMILTTTKPSLYLYHIQGYILSYKNETNSIYNYFSSASYYHFLLDKQLSIMLLYSHNRLSNSFKGWNEDHWSPKFWRNSSIERRTLSFKIK